MGAPGTTSQSVFDGSHHGIRPDDKKDQAEAMQAALDELGASGGGVLQLAEGRYMLSRPVFICHSNVVLRGAGKHRTTLEFPHPLEDVLGRALGPDGISSGWSWNGGQVFVIARERLEQSQRSDWATTDGHTEGWLAGELLANVGPAPRGAQVISVEDTSKLVAGDMVLLDVEIGQDYATLRHMAGDVAGARTYDWEGRASMIAGPERFSDFRTWSWPVKVVEVLSPRTIRLEQPLKTDIGDGTPARLRDLGPTVHDSGVEGLTIENALRAQTTHNLNPGSNGLCFQAVYDCWATDVHVVNADCAYSLTSAKSCTLSGISAGGRSLHHFVACRTQSHDNLIEDFELEEFSTPAVRGSYFHGLNVEGLSSGNVYRRGVLHTGTFDSHRALPFENLRTDITITNKDAVPGGALTAGPYFGARTVNWGVAVTNGNNLCIDVSDVSPRSITAGITGLSKPGSILPQAGMDFAGDLESETLAFGVDLGEVRDLLEVQRATAPIA